MRSLGSAKSFKELILDYIALSTRQHVLGKWFVINFPPIYLVLSADNTVDNRIGRKAIAATIVIN